MRTTLLALPALLSALVVAIPSPAAPLQQPLQSPAAAAAAAAPSSRWRSLSDRLIGAVFGVEHGAKNGASHKHTAMDRPARQPPAHTLARYEGDMVLRFNISTAKEAEGLREAADTLLLDVWEHTHDWVDIRLSKDIVPSLLGLLPDTLQQSHAPLLHERDLAHAIYNTYPLPKDQPAPQTSRVPSPLDDRAFSPALHPNAPTSNTNNGDTNLFFQDYQPLSVLYPWMRFLASFFTTHTRLVTLGTSYEGREILGLRIGVHPTNAADPAPPRRKTILVTGGLHAREWISTSTAAYVAFALVTGYGKAQPVTTLLEAFDFVVVPTLNPDGYEYSWSTDRLWRKNRQPTAVRFCAGVDLDRAFGFEWDAVSTAGNPCSENFAGAAPWDAAESKVLADWARHETDAHAVDFVGLLDLHSYSQQILYPYSYSCAATPPGQENLEELALGLAKSIRLASGSAYDVLAACEGNVALDAQQDKTLLPRIEEQGGSALDWFYHELRVKYAYQVKLRDRGTYGFLLPREHIVPTGRETLEAVLYLGQFLREEMVGQSEEPGEVVEGEVEVEEDVDEGRVDGEEIEAWIEGAWVVVDEEEGGDESSASPPQIELRRRRRR